MTESPGRQIKHRGAAAKVVEYMLTTDGREIHLGRIARDMGLDNEVVSGALSYLIKENRGGIVRVRSEWYQCTKVTPVRGGRTGAIYEQIGVAQDGTPLLRSEDMVIYRLGDPL
jgi:hypothetical protein